MLVTISIACHNRSDMTAQFLRCVEDMAKQRDDIEWIFTDNASIDDTFALLGQFQVKNKILVRHGVNLGFGSVHNAALKMAKGKYFIVLNNDIFMHESDWVEKLIQPMTDSKVAIVGLIDEPCMLKPDGNGVIGNVRDYVEGSCLAGRTETFRKYGLFSPGLKKYYFEDSDCSLRYRQMGYKLAHVKIKHEHHRGATARTLQDANRGNIVAYNNSVFIKRWSKYLQNRVFNNSVLIRMHSIGIGDILAFSPVLEGLRIDYPTAMIELEVSAPELFEGNPHVSKVYPIRKRHDRVYDRIIDITPNYHSLDLIARQAEIQAATKIYSYLPQIFLAEWELSNAEEKLTAIRNQFETIIILALQMDRIEWQGRNWRREYVMQLVKMIKEYNPAIGIVEVGNKVKSTGLADLDLVDKTDVRELCGVIAASDMFIGIDSLPFHIAQAYGIRSYVLFGATHPIARVIDFKNTNVIQNRNLMCLACYHRAEAFPINKCKMRNELCMIQLTPQIVFDYITSSKNPYEENIEYLQNIIRRNVYED